MTRFAVTDEEDGQRLDVVLAARLAVSRSRAANRIAAGEVQLDGQVVGKQQRLRSGQRIDVADTVAPTPAPAPPLPPIRYRDDDLLVLSKPPGLVVHPGAGHRGDTLVDALLAADIPLAAVGDADRPGIVHRLDRDTSGLLLVASTERAHAGLVDALRRRTVERRYLAMVQGVPASPRGRIEAPIGRHPRDRTRFAVVAEGKPAVTRYETVATATVPFAPADGTRSGDEAGSAARAGDLALLACRLETGRTHQIRVHLHELGHGIVGDRTYGPRGPVGVRLPRPFLHAASLRLAHPISGRPLAFTDPLPDDLAAAIRTLGLDGEVARWFADLER